MKERVDGRTPLDFNRLRLSKVKSTAAGVPAAISSINHGSSLSFISIFIIISNLVFYNYRIFFIAINNCIINLGIKFAMKFAGININEGTETLLYLIKTQDKITGEYFYKNKVTPSSNFSIGSGSITLPDLLTISDSIINFVEDGPSGTSYTA